MPAVPEVTRAQVLAHRVRTNGLDRAVNEVEDLVIADLGVQDTGAVGASGTLVARLGDGGLDLPPAWVRTWTVRGAPHWHRSDDLLALARATWPMDSSDAGARLVGVGTTFKKAGIDPLDGLRRAAEALRSVVAEPTPKGEVSAAITEVLPAEYSYECRPCGATHVHDQLLRLAALPAGIHLRPGTSPPVLDRIADWPGAPTRQDGADALTLAYLRVHGPTTPASVATYLQTNRRSVKATWPRDLAEVRVEGAAMWLPADQLDDLLGAPMPELVRLLPSCDPWLLARDRELVVPDKAHHKALWPVIGWPGAVLVDGEVVGTWRTKATTKRLTIEVLPFARLAEPTIGALEVEADLVRRIRGVDDVQVTVATR